MPKAVVRTVKVSELKVRLSEYLRIVRRGYPVTVCDRDTPIARLVPYDDQSEQLTVRKPIHALHELALPKPNNRQFDSLAVLLEERQASR